MPQTKQIQGIHKDNKSTDDQQTSRPTGQITRLPSYIGSDDPPSRLQAQRFKAASLWGIVVISG